MSAEHVQSPEQGPDPSLNGPRDTKSLKMTGEGAPGSHSAVFGLTPDGQKHDETAQGTTASKPAPSDGGRTAVGGGTIPKSEAESSNTGSTAVSGGAVADQMNDPRVVEKGHNESAVESTAGVGEKPGAGVDIAPQGSGQVGQEGGLMGKVRSYITGS